MPKTSERHQELQPRGVEENEERFCPKPGGALANRPWKEAVRIVPRTAKGHPNAGLLLNCDQIHAKMHSAVKEHAEPWTGDGQGLSPGVSIRAGRLHEY